MVKCAPQNTLLQHKDDVELNERENQMRAAHPDLPFPPENRRSRNRNILTTRVGPRPRETRADRRCELGLHRCALPHNELPPKPLISRHLLISFSLSSRPNVLRWELS